MHVYKWALQTVEWTAFNMADVLTREQRSYNMSRIRGKDTTPELRLRKLLFSRGLRGYRTKSKLFGKPDIAFTRFKVAVFIDGCFWHRCPVCFVRPETNPEFWKNKIEGNVKRDKIVKERLEEEGYKVIRLWEHEVRKDAEKCYLKISGELAKKGLRK